MQVCLDRHLISRETIHRLESACIRECRAIEVPVDEDGNNDDDNDNDDDDDATFLSRSRDRRIDRRRPIPRLIRSRAGRRENPIRQDW